MYLLMLFEIGPRGEFFLALEAFIGLVTIVYPFMSYQIRYLQTKLFRKLKIKSNSEQMQRKFRQAYLRKGLSAVFMLASVRFLLVMDSCMLLEG